MHEPCMVLTGRDASVTGFVYFILNNEKSTGWKPVQAHLSPLPPSGKDIQMTLLAIF